MVNDRSQARGGAATAATHARKLLRVEGVTYTIDELAKVVGCTPAEIRLRANRLINRRSQILLQDFRHG